MGKEKELLPSLKGYVDDVWSRLDLKHGFFGEYVNDAEGFRNIVGFYNGIVVGEGVLRVIMEEEERRDNQGRNRIELSETLSKDVTMFISRWCWMKDFGKSLLDYFDGEYGSFFEEGVESFLYCSSTFRLRIRVSGGDVWDSAIREVWGSHLLNVVTWRGVYCMMPWLTLSQRVYFTFRDDVSTLLKRRVAVLFDEVGRDEVKKMRGEMKGYRFFGDKYCLQYDFNEGGVGRYPDPLVRRGLYF